MSISLSEATPTIEDVDRALGEIRGGLGLPDVIERCWERDRGGRRAGQVATAALAFALGYGILGLAETRLIGDGFGLTAFSTLLVVGTVAIALALLIRQGCSPAVRETGAAALTFVAGATTLWVFRATTAETAEHYHYLVIVPILFGNLVLRPRFVYAAATSVATLWLYVMVLGTSTIPSGVVVSATLGVAATTIFSLVAGRAMERELFSAYLRELRVAIAADRLSHRYDELSAESLCDPLTGVANRRRVEGHLRDMAARSTMIGEPLALLMIDVDHFKAVNDGFGHPAGDACLKQVASVAQEQVRRKDDLVGRFGGEEFLVILPDTSLADGIRVAERIRAAIAAETVLHGEDGTERVVTASIGVAADRIRPGRSVDDLLAEADAALYAAKHGGRNRVKPSLDALDERIAPRAWSAAVA
jgi:diguanylate cyclase (GGDEF)-like protein